MKESDTQKQLDSFELLICGLEWYWLSFTCWLMESGTYVLLGSLALTLKCNKPFDYFDSISLLESWRYGVTDSWTRILMESWTWYRHGLMNYWTDKVMDSGLKKSWTHGLIGTLWHHEAVDPLVQFIFSMGWYLLFGTLASWTHEQVYYQTQGLMYLRLMRTLGSCGLGDSWVLDLWTH